MRTSDYLYAINSSNKLMASKDTSIKDLCRRIVLVANNYKTLTIIWPLFKRLYRY